MGGRAVIRGAAALEKALEAGHAPLVRGEIWVNDRRIERIDVGEGTVSLNGEQFQQRSGTIEVRATREARELLATPGANVRVWRGAEGAHGTIPALWGPASAPSRGWGAASISVTVEDLARRVLRDNFPTPRESTPGATVAQQILLLWRESVPWCSWVDLSGDRTAVPRVTWEENRSEAINSLAESIGCETWIRPTGEVVLRPVRSAISGVDFRARARHNLSEHTDTWDWDSVYNHVVVRSDNAENPVSGEYADWNSPTGIVACGRNTLIVSLETVTTSAQCAVAAQAYVLRSQGQRISGDFTAAIHPGVEVGDIHHVVTTEGQRRYVVDTVSWDLHGAGMTVSGRIPSIADGLESQ